MIDLRSDTVTVPSPKMRAFMAEAPVGDDAYGEDPSVAELEKKCCTLFQKEAALFVTSGMMANRLAFLSQTNPGDEVITEYDYHVHFFDSAPMSAFAGVVFNARKTQDGILRVEEIERALHSKQRYDYFAQARLISVENSINGLAGKIFPIEILKELYLFTREKNLSIHLDGARLFNVHIATGIPLHEYGQWVDTLSVCFSKGLGAPYGSVLMGSSEVIRRARRFRLWLGGGIHQGGMLAAGCEYALTHHLENLHQDHVCAQTFSKGLESIEGISLCHSLAETNIVQFRVQQSCHFLKRCEERGLHLFPWLPGIFRAVFHRGIAIYDVEEAISIIQAAVLLEASV